MKQSRLGLSLLFLLSGIGLMTFSTAWAAPAPPTGQDLQSVQQEIKQAQEALQAKQAAQKNVQQTLQKTQAALSQQEQELSKLTREQKQVWGNLRRLQQNLDALQTQVGGAQAQVTRLLNSQYKNKQPDALVLLLKNSDPNQKGRRLQYIRYIQQANQKVIADLRSQQGQLKNQQQQIQAQLGQLKQLQQRQQQVVGKLKQQNSAQVRANQALNADIDRQSRTLTELKNDERRLNQLLSSIGKRSAAKTRAKQQTAQIKPKPVPRLPEKARTGDTSEPADTTPGLTAEDMQLHPSDAAAVTEVPVAENNTFSRLQGRMRLPVSGSLNGRFGTARSQGGTWKGVFIATAPARVEAVAAGEVAYAGALQGYGNTVVIDHGGQYLTVYTGLSSIGVASGSHIASRASLGTSGSLPSGEQGLYFEIRYLNRPLNPLSWVS